MIKDLADCAAKVDRITISPSHGGIYIEVKKGPFEKGVTMTGGLTSEDIENLVIGLAERVLKHKDCHDTQKILDVRR